MTCETAESCTASLTYTRSEAADEDKAVTVTISAKNDVSGNFLLGDVLNIPPIELILNERSKTYFPFFEQPQNNGFQVIRLSRPRSVAWVHDANSAFRER